MVKYFFMLVIGFVLGAILVEYKQYLNHYIPSPIAVLPDGGVYDGDIQQGKFHGKGRLRWPNNSYYEGNFEHGSFHGMGLLHTENFIYDGEFQQGVAEGSGTLTYANGDEYTGQVHRMVPEGEGIMTLKNGDRYQGGFAQGVYSGYGELTTNSGAVYIGGFNKGQFAGKGVYTQYRNITHKRAYAQTPVQQHMANNSSVANAMIYRGEFSKGQLSGEGVWVDGQQRYEGGFIDWKFHGKGVYTSNNESYMGTFANGLYHGKGRYQHVSGLAYEGEFRFGDFAGKGILTNEFGDRFTGEFQDGVRHGKGKVTYAEALDGIKSYTGVWEQGRLKDASDKRMAVTASQRVEHALYAQQTKTQQQLDAINQQDPEKIDMYFIAVAGDGNEAVFRREVEWVRAQFEKDYLLSGKTAILANTRINYEKYPLATLTSIEQTLRTVANKMDANNDILFLYLTSHGSSDFYLSLDQPGVSIDDISAKQLGDILQSLPVRHKVVVISACYSGGFVKSLKNSHTMIITAASADRASFGCHDRAQMTYFGEAFFKDALPQSSNFVDAFYRARDGVKKLERKQGFAHSNPLIFKPEAILTKLAEWRAQLQQDLAEQALLTTQ